MDYWLRGSPVAHVTHSLSMDHWWAGSPMIQLLITGARAPLAEEAAFAGRLRIYVALGEWGHMLPLGDDLTAVPDLELMTHGGVPNLAEAITRRLTTPRGGLFYDPDYGVDLRRYLNEAATEEVQFEIARLAEEQAEEDPRVARATAQVSFEQSTRTLTVHLTIELATEQSPLVLEASNVTVEVLRAA